MRTIATDIQAVHRDRSMEVRENGYPRGRSRFFSTWMSDHVELYLQRDALLGTGVVPEHLYPVWI